MQNAAFFLPIIVEEKRRKVNGAILFLERF